MLRKSKPQTPAVEQAITNAVSYEVSIADLARRSERRAWWVAGASLLMSLALAGGYYYMLPLKEKVPYMVMADANTGTATLVRMQQDQRYADMTTSEIVARSYISRYIQARESYDYELLRSQDFREVYLLSTPEVVADYAKKMQDTSKPTHPDKIYGTDRSVRVRIVSIQFGQYVPETQTYGATVRFQRSLFNKREGTTTYDGEGQIASLTYRFNSNLKLSDEDSVVNPLGFQVSSYRLDTDYSVATAPDGPLPFANQLNAQATASAAQSAQPGAAATPEGPNTPPATGEAVPTSPAQFTPIPPAQAPAAATPESTNLPPQPQTNNGDGANQP